MKTLKWGTAAVVLFMALSMLLMVVPAGASPDVYPCNFYGTATVDGTPVAAGTEISAWFESTQVASAVTGAGSLADNEYSLVVNLDEANEGEAVSFKIGTLWANETGIWQKLMAVEVNLTAFTGADTTSPEVISTSPVDGAIGVAVGTSVTATFSEAIDEATLVFTLDSVAGTVTYAGTTAIFDPLADLAYSTTYTASIYASDLAGNPMVAPYTWSFTTGAAPAEVPEEPVPTARLSIRNLRISPNQVTPAQAVTIYVDVVNYGDRWGSKVLTLLINGMFEQSTRVGVSPHTSKTVSFTVHRAAPGQYSVDIEGVTGWFSVGAIIFVSEPSDGGLGTGDVIAIVVISIVLIAGITVTFLVARR